MQATANSTKGNSRLTKPVSVAVIVYLLAIPVVWWKCPSSPRQVFRAGHRAKFAGFAPEGQSLITIDEPLHRFEWHEIDRPRFVRVWNSETGKLRREISWNGMIKEHIGITPDGKRLFVESDYYSLATLEKLPESRWIADVKKARLTESLDSDLMVLSTTKSVVHDGHTGEQLFEVSLGCAAACRDDGRELAVAIDAHHGSLYPERPRFHLQFFDPRSGQESRALLKMSGTVRTLAYSPRGDKLAVVINTGATRTDPGELQLWDLANNTLKLTAPLTHDASIHARKVKFLAGGDVVVVESPFGCPVWDTTWQVSDRFVGATGPGVLPPITNQAGSLAAYYDSSSGELVVEQLGLGAQQIVSRRRYPHPGAVVLPYQLTPDDRLITVKWNSSNPGTLDRLKQRFLPTSSECEVLDAQTGESLGGIHFPRDTAALGVSPDGRTMVTSSSKWAYPDEFALWDLPTGTPWLAIFGWALLPAIFAGIVWRYRQARRAAKPAEAKPVMSACGV